MNLEWTETQTVLREALREYLQREVDFDRIRRLDRERTWDAALWQGLAEQGWLALCLGGEAGDDAGLIETGILVEELARRAAVVPILEVTAAARVIARYASAELGREVASDVLSGRRRPVPALSEGEEAAAEGAVVARDGRLRGAVAFVDYGQFATDHLVAAHTDDGAGLYLVDPSDPGVELRPRQSIGRTPVVSADYRDVAARRVAGAAACAELGRLGRALAAVQCLGCMEQALAMTLAYARVREQFGRPIGSFQAVQHHCANMATRVASGRFLVYEALGALDRGCASEEQVALAKASVSRSLPEVTMLAHQIHGGNGVIEENDLYFFTLRGKERSLAWGTADACLAVAAATITEPCEWL